jgi:hypothetical protein
VKLQAEPQETREIMVHPVLEQERAQVAAELLREAVGLALERGALVEVQVQEVVPGWILCRMNLSRTLLFRDLKTLRI